MSFSPISNHVERMKRHVSKLPSPDHADLKTRASILAATTYGIESVTDAPALINIAALTLSLSRLIAHRITKQAIDQINETDLRSLPGEAPILMRSPWIIESRRPERFSLFGNTASFAGYELEDALYLIGLEYPDGVNVARVKITWEEDHVEPPAPSPLVEDDEAYQRWAKEAVHWIVTLGALMDAEKTPIDVARTHAKRKKGNGKIQNRDSNEWIVRRVSIKEGNSSQREKVSSELNLGGREGMVLVDTWVRGHLKRQPYGPGLALRKWVYVESYEAKRWQSTRPVRVDVL